MGDILQWVTYYPLLQSPWFYRAKARSCLPRRAKGASFSTTCPVPLARVLELILDARCSTDAAGPTLAGHPTLSLPTGVRTEFLFQVSGKLDRRPRPRLLRPLPHPRPEGRGDCGRCGWGSSSHWRGEAARDPASGRVPRT